MSSTSFPIVKVSIAAPELRAGQNITVMNSTISTTNNPSFSGKVSGGTYNLKAGVGLSFDGIQYAVAQSAGGGIDIVQGTEYTYISSGLRFTAQCMIGVGSLIILIDNTPNTQSPIYLIPYLPYIETVQYNMINSVATITQVADALYNASYNAVFQLYSTIGAGTSACLGLFDPVSGSLINGVTLNVPYASSRDGIDTYINLDATGSILYYTVQSGTSTQLVVTAYDVAAMFTASTLEVMSPLWQTACSFSTLTYIAGVFMSPNHLWAMVPQYDLYDHTPYADYYSVVDIVNQTAVTFTTASTLESPVGVVDSGTIYSINAHVSSLSGIYQYNGQGTLVASSLNINVYDFKNRCGFLYYGNTFYSMFPVNSGIYDQYIITPDLSFSISVQVTSPLAPIPIVPTTHKVYLYGNTYYMMYVKV